MNACFSINSKKNYFRVRWQGMAYDYPLNLVKEYKTQHDFTYQDVANQILNTAIKPNTAMKFAANQPH